MGVILKGGKATSLGNLKYVLDHLSRRFAVLIVCFMKESSVYGKTIFFSAWLNFPRV